VRKGFIFSLDVLVAIGILLLLTIFLVSLSFSFSSPELTYQRIYFSAKDVITLMGETKIKDVQDFDTVSQYLADGNLTQEDLNESYIKIVGAFWASNDTEDEERAENMTKEFLNKTLPGRLGYEFLIDGESVDKRNISNNETFLARIISISSGFQKGQPVSGFVARAFAVKIKKNTTDVFAFNPEGVGNAAGAGTELKIKKKFFINSTQIINAQLFVALHTGRATLHSQNNFLVNGVDVVPISTVVEDTEKDDARIVFYKADVTPYINNSWNTVEFRLFKQNQPPVSHLHPATRVEVKYTTDSVRSINRSVNVTQYFDNIASPGKPAAGQRGGLWAVMPIFIPISSQIRNVTLHLNASNVANMANRNDVRIFFNNISIYNESDPPSNYILDLNLTGNVSASHNQTNVLSVYINYFPGTAPDETWGPANQDVTLYSDQQNNPAGSSYVKIEYDIPTEIFLRFGFIDVNVVQNFTGPKSNPKNHTTDFDGQEPTQTFVHVAQQDSINVNISVQPEGQQWREAFRTLLNESLPSTVYIDPTFYNISLNNTLIVRDECTNLCNILNESSFEFTILVPSSVGFGAVFPTELGAVNDAITRLNESLGKFIIATQIQTVNSSVSGIKSLWGPAIFELRTWI